MSDATEAWENYRARKGEVVLTTGPSQAFKAGFAAGQVAALEDAADAVVDASDGESAWWYEDWLRARAAELSKEQHDQPDA